MRRFAQKVAACAILFSFLVAGTVSQAAETATHNVRLRLEWGGGEPTAWQGKITVAGNGQLELVQLLGLDTAEASTIWQEDNAIRISQESPREYSGVEFTVEGPSADKIQFELSPANAKKPITRQVSISEVLHKESRSALDKLGNEVILHRAPGDILRVSLDRESLVFSPGEDFSLDVSVHEPGVPANSRLRLQANLFEQGKSNSLWSSPQSLSSTVNGIEPASVTLPIKIPQQEGVYEIQLELRRGKITPKLRITPVTATRKVQFVVVNPNPLEIPASTNANAWRTVMEIDPTSTAWWNRLMQITSILSARSTSREGEAVERFTHPLGKMVRLGAAANQASSSWVMYPLNVQEPGRPHLLEIEYPSDVEQGLGICLLEGGTGNGLGPIGPFSTCYSEAPRLEQTARMLVHQMVVWPRTKNPALLVVNQRTAGPSVFGKIRLQALQGGKSNSPNTTRLPRFAAPSAENRRILSAFLDRPLLPEITSSPEAIDPETGFALDDWNTFLLAANRLADYMHFAGYEGLMLCVAADGGAIYPSKHLGATPRFDTGVFFTTGQDPLRKDVLELLLRVFDREGLKLIPCLQFDAHLPELESLLRASDESQGLVLVDAENHSLREGHADRDITPAYNPLDPRVQQAMLQVTQELIDRCQGHASFAGMGINLSADGFAQLPSGDVGFDPVTVERFLKQLPEEFTPPETTSPEEVIGWIQNEHRDDWLKWRARNLGDFYERMESALLAARPDARLYLNPVDSLSGSEMRHAMWPDLLNKRSAQEALFQCGLLGDLLPRDQQLTLTRVSRLAPLDPLSAQAPNLLWNGDTELDESSSQRLHTTALFYHEPLEIKFPQEAIKAMFKRNAGRGLCQGAPSDYGYRKRFVHALATLDAVEMFDGGWHFSLGQEKQLQRFLSVYRELPAARFALVKGSPQPVVIRRYDEGDNTFVYAVNDSSLPVTIRLRPNVDEPIAGRWLGVPTPESESLFDDDGLITISLEPYDLRAFSLSQPSVGFNADEIELAFSDTGPLDEQIKDLWNRLAVLDDGRPLPAVENADFETANAGGSPTGWSLEGSQAKGVLRQGQAVHGASYVVFSNSGKFAALQSSPVVPAKTGRMHVSVHLRGNGQGQAVTCRAVIEGRLNGDIYRRAALFSGGDNEIQLPSEWDHFLFKFDELPVTGFTDLRLRFEMTGPGEVWLDHVEFFDHVFSPDERLELSKLIGLAEFLLRQKNYADCNRVLDEYWPRFLRQYVPLQSESPPDKSALQVESPAASPPSARKKGEAGILDRMRRIFPRLGGRGMDQRN